MPNKIELHHEQESANDPSSPSAEHLERLADMIAARIRPKELMKPEEAANFLGFSWGAFRQCAWSKAIPFVRIGIKKFYKLED